MSQTAQPAHPYPPSLLKRLIANLSERINPEIQDELGVSPLFLELVEESWQATYSALFDKPEKPFVSRLAAHHAEAIEWHWNARLALLRGEEPDYRSYFPIWSRGHMKSTVARRIVVVDALLSVAFGEQAYVLYVSRNKEMAIKHAKSIETLITEKQITRFCPGLAKVKTNEQNSSKGWTDKFIYTSVGAIFHFAGLDEGLAGGNVDDVRPTCVFLDDIDGREPSPVIGQSRFNKLTTEILPMRQANTLQFWAQNLITRYTAMYRIQSGQERVLTDRKPTQPIPAVIGLETEVRTIDGIVRDIIVAGTPTWAFYDLKRCQEEINTIGLAAFKRECQHEVEESSEGLIAHNYNDKVHVISFSEFARIYGTRSIPEEWTKWAINDWANTKTDRHANVAAWVTVSSQNTPLPGFNFIFYPMSFKANPEPEDVAERIISRLTPFAYRRVTWAKLRKDALLRTNATLHTNSLQERLEFERGLLSKSIKKFARSVFKKFNVKPGVMGHSDETVKKIYSSVYGLELFPVNPGKRGGIEDLNRWQKIDENEPHPFRPGEKGYTRWFIVAPDDKNQKPKIIDGAAIYPPVPYKNALAPHELHDWDLIRYQLKNWRFREPALTATGELIDDPLKVNDDFGQALQMFYFKKLIGQVKLTTKEKIISALPEKTRVLAGKKNLSMGEQLALEEAYKETEKKVKKIYNPRLNSLGTDTPEEKTSDKFTLNEHGFEDIYN